MAIRYAVKTGNWSDPTTWDGGTLPTSADDVYSNNFTVTIDTSPTVLSISNASATGVTAGGIFELSNGTVLTCTATDGITGSGLSLVCRLAVAGSAVVNANIGSTGSLSNTNLGTLTLNGNYVGPSRFIFNVPPFGPITNISGGVFNLNGTYSVSITSNNSGTIMNASSGTMNITGSVEVGSSTSQAYNTINRVNLPVSNRGSGALNITGEIKTSGFSCPVVNNTGTGTLNITSNIGSNGHGYYVVLNEGSGVLNIYGSVTAGSTWPVIGPGSTSQVTFFTGPLIPSANGVNSVIALRWFVRETTLPTFSYGLKSSTTDGDGNRFDRPLYAFEGLEDTLPAESDVRLGVAYGPGGERVGAVAMPPPSTVAIGVPVENTVGSATITANDFWNVPLNLIGGEGTVGRRIKNSATISSTGEQIAALGA